VVVALVEYAQVNKVEVAWVNPKNKPVNGALDPEGLTTSSNWHAELMPYRRSRYALPKVKAVRKNSIIAGGGGNFKS
jgi:hypothetical protein